MELTFKEAAVRLGVLVFKRSVLETRKKSKSIFRSKNRPAMRELLSLAPPRSPTEKLLCEMFGGLCAQFMAVLEALREASCRPFGHISPAPVTELDKDTVADVYQVCVCVCVCVHACACVCVRAWCTCMWCACTCVLHVFVLHVFVPVLGYGLFVCICVSVHMCKMI